MPDAAINITNTNLIAQLKQSFIAEDQQKELEALIPTMNDTDRQELLALIEQSKVEDDKAEAEYQEGLGKLNEDHQKKMNDMVKDETSAAYKEFEKEDQASKATEEKELDVEISTVENSKKAGSSATQKNPKRKHGLFKLILFLLLLLALAGGAVYGLTFL